MLEERLRRLEEEKNKAIERVRAATIDNKKYDQFGAALSEINQELLKLAVNDINVCYASAVNYLNLLSRNGFSVNEDLSRMQEIYNTNGDYRDLYNKFMDHLLDIRDKIPDSIEHGRFTQAYPLDYNP